MSRGKLLAIVIAITSLGVGAMVVRTEFAHPPTISATQAVGASPTDGQAAQERAEKRNEQEGLEHACAALKKLGATNKVCPH